LSSDPVDASPYPDRARDPYPAIEDQLEREEGITTTPKVLPSGARHGGGGKFVLADRDRDSERILEKFNISDDGRNLSDGSLYQHARAAWYANEDELVEDHDGRKYAVLNRSYKHPAEDEPDEYAVTLRSSRYEAGTGEGNDYSAWYKYDLTVRPVGDDGEIQWKATPPRSLSLKIEPQVEDLVYPDGNDFRLPHGEGSLVRVQTTWVNQTEEFLERAAHLVGHTLNYGLRQADVVEDSAAFSKAEVHHRVVEEVEGDIVHTIRQSADLLARHEADVDTRGKHEDGKWLKCKIRTDQWEQLGFPRLDAKILIKLYYPDDPDQVEYPLNQPKLEVALDGKETVIDEETGRKSEKMVPWDRWDEIMAILEEILLSHLEWADVGPEKLVADDYSDGAQNPPLRWRHPDGRRYWLRKHYESLVPALYREATKPNTDLIYDILDVVRRRGEATYRDLINETGAAKRTIREHVRRLEQQVGGDERPGLLKREQGSVTVVSFSSRYLEELTDNEGRHALDKINPDDTPEERSERTNERAADHLESLGIPRSDSEDYASDIVDAEFVEAADVRDAEDIRQLENVLEKSDEVGDESPGVDLSEYQNDFVGDQAETEPFDEDRRDAEEEFDEGSPGPDNSESPQWSPFGDVPIDSEALAYALEGDSIDEDHVKIRVDPYPTLSD